MVAKAQQAAADAAQRSDEEAAKLKHELEALKREKRGLVQRCISAERDLAAATVRSLIALCITLSAFFVRVMHTEWLRTSYWIIPHLGSCQGDACCTAMTNKHLTS